jgi:hypothetical protein
MWRYFKFSLVFMGLAMCALATWHWARSYRWASLSHLQLGNHPFEILSVEGRLKFTSLPRSFQRAFRVRRQDYSTSSPESDTISRHTHGFSNAAGFGYRRGQNATILIPHWFLVFLSGIATAFCGIKRLRRFSMRTLLIATAMIAVLLSFIVGLK